jgi:hypothetical protein
MRSSSTSFKYLALTFGLVLGILAPAKAAEKKPNILVIWGDDIGNQNISYNSRGMMGYQTPNIDRIAKEGVAFTDYYAQQSCTAVARRSSAAASPFATA